MHRPAHHLQLEHAQHHARSALSALHAIPLETLTAAEHERLSRLASQLADVAAELAGDRP
mgnify:CR=1 FL=1